MIIFRQAINEAYPYSKDPSETFRSLTYIGKPISLFSTETDDYTFFNDFHILQEYKEHIVLIC